jgi:hypothetical protein
MIQKEDRDYLSHLVDETAELRNSVQYREISSEDVAVSYLSPVRRPFIGYFQGPFEMLKRERYRMKERRKRNAGCSNFLKVSRSNSGELLEIASYKKGCLDCIHQSVMNNNRLFLFPFAASGCPYPAYSYVTVYDGTGIVEEYAVSGSQILYGSYAAHAGEKMYDYYYINFVKNGSIPVLEEMSGVITTDPLSYTETFHDYWVNRSFGAFR